MSHDPAIVYHDAVVAHRLAEASRRTIEAEKDAAEDAAVSRLTQEEISAEYTGILKGFDAARQEDNGDDFMESNHRRLKALARASKS